MVKASDSVMESAIIMYDHLPEAVRRRRDLLRLEPRQSITGHQQKLSATSKKKPLRTQRRETQGKARKQRPSAVLDKQLNRSQAPSEEEPREVLTAKGVSYSAVSFPGHCWNIVFKTSNKSAKMPHE
ncbi:hypothetical protein SRHO_G00085870 [Serrasalmus rhombeus]